VNIGLRLWSLFRPYQGWLVAGFVFACVAMMANIALLALAGWFITAMAVAGLQGGALNYVLPAAAIRSCALLRTGGRYLERLVIHEATLRQLAGLRVWFYHCLEPLVPAVVQELHSGDLLSRLRSDIDALDTFYARIIVPTLTALVTTICIILFTAWYEPRLALALLLWLSIAGIGLPWLVHRLSVRAGPRLITLETTLRQSIVDGIQGLPELIVYDAADRHAEQLYQLTNHWLHEQRTMRHLNSLAHSGLLVLASLALWSSIWLGLPLLHQGTLAPAQLVMLTMLALASFEAVMPLPGAFQQLETMLTAARRIFSIADMTPAVIEPAPTQPPPQPQNQHLRFRNVNFYYPKATQPTLIDINLELAPGRRVALVGPSGSGKTTLLHLVLKFWAHQQGDISYGGVSLADWPSDDWRQNVTLVSQHTDLFAATIRDNLLVARPNASQAELETACRLARLHDVIQALPDQYETWVGETGVRLSGGQARRLAIARALLKQAPLLLLDEPTEGLDAATERELMAALEPLMAERAVLLVTHRPIALAAMDEILVLEAGRIRERGTHRDLLTQELYPRLLGFTEQHPAAADHALRG
jgi:ATP-binding cassette subfamily C protein CydC